MPQNPENRCMYERFTGLNPDFKFIDQGKDTYLIDQTGIQFLKQSFGYVNEDLFRTICERCQLCLTHTVEADDRTWYQVIRHGYIEPEKREDLWTINKFVPKNKISELKIAVIDDEIAEEVAKNISIWGYETYSVKPHKTYGFNWQGQADLEKAIFEIHPGIIFCDVGLGRASGISVLRKAKEKGVISVIFTAQYDSSWSELADIYDYVLEKPAKRAAILAILDNFK